MCVVTTCIQVPEFTSTHLHRTLCLCAEQGLSVDLKPYQRQSLKFMLDREKADGGFRHNLFCQVTNSKGEVYWYSPVLGRLCAHVPPMAQGGILGAGLSLSPVLLFSCIRGLLAFC